MVIIAVPSDPRKRPKKPATELPSRGKKTISRYIFSSVFIKQKNQTWDKNVCKAAYKALSTWLAVVSHARRQESFVLQSRDWTGINHRCFQKGAAATLRIQFHSDLQAYLQNFSLRETKMEIITIVLVENSALPRPRNHLPTQVYVSTRFWCLRGRLVYRGKADEARGSDEGYIWSALVPMKT